MSYLKLVNIGKVFKGDVVAVDDANIEVEKGSFFTFLGPSGCGKTTTLRMIAGFETPTSGKIYMDDKDITFVSPEKKEIGMMFQNYALFPHMTVGENVAYGLKIKKMPKDKIKEQVLKYMSMVGLAGYEKRKITELSGGEQQRVALARSLAMEPKILLLDEPLSNLDAKMRDEMRFELKRIQRELGITMLYVTHDQNEALMMSDKIAVFSKGKIQQIDVSNEIYNHPKNKFVANFVGQTNLFDIDSITNQTVTLKNGLSFKTNSTLTQGEYVSIRNENIILSKTKTKAENEYKALVKSKQFNGLVSYYTLVLNDVEFNATRTNEIHAFQPNENEEIYVCIPKESVIVLEE